MPTYEYKCDNCEHEFEIYQSMKDDKLTKCPSCRQNTLKRLIGTGGGLIFKGSGFYLTDYKNKPEESQSSKGTSNEIKKKEVTPTSTDTAKTDIKETSDSNSKQSEKKSSKVKTDKD